MFGRCLTNRPARWPRVTLPLCLGLGLAMGPGCRANVDDSLVEIQYAVQPDSTCNFGVNNAPLGAGTYDPTIAQKQDGFLLGLVLRNNLEARSQEPLTLDSTVNVRNRFNDMKVIGFEGCWAQNNGASGTLRSAKNGQVLDCSRLPNQSGSLSSSGQLDEGGAAQGLSYVRVLTLPHLQQIFGAAFSPADLPARGLFTVPSFDANANLNCFGLAPAAPNDPNGRAAAWGSKYPASREASVLVQLRAVLASQAGETLHSGWFAIPITLCPGCAKAACGNLQQRQCPLPCPTGAPCSGGTCTVGTATVPCSYQPEMTGYLNDLLAPAACLPAQFGGPPLCTTKSVGCPTSFLAQ
jgi:hypothetical protein